MKTEILLRCTIIVFASSMFFIGCQSNDDSSNESGTEYLLSDDSAETLVAIQHVALSYDTTMEYEQFLCQDDNMSWDTAEANAERFFDQVDNYRKESKHDASSNNIMCKRTVDYILSCNRSDGYVTELECGAFYRLFKDNDCFCNKLSDYMNGNKISSSCQDTIWHRIASFIDDEIWIYDIDTNALNDRTKIVSAMDSVHWKEFKYLSRHRYFLRCNYE